MNVSQARLQLLDAVCIDLMGSCSTLSNVLENHGIDEDSITIPEYTHIDTKVWECKTCNWWVEPCEIDEHDTCEDCRESDD